MKNNTKYNISFVLLLLTALFWGAGFVFSEEMLINGMPSALINMLRFGIGAIALLIIFAKKIKLTKKSISWSVLCGFLLFVGFELQLFAMHYTTPAQSGLFSVGYILFVPFIVWMTKKHRPSAWTLTGVGVALIGFYILSISGNSSSSTDFSKNYIGNLITICAALCFAMHISIVDHLMDTQIVDGISLSTLQITFSAIFFVIFFLVTALPTTNWQAIAWEKTWWIILVVAVMNTAFAYYSQTYAQTIINPATASLIMALEAPIGAFLSVITGHDPFTWNLVVGSALVTIALLLVEFVPQYLAERKLKRATPANN